MLAVNLSDFEIPLCRIPKMYGGSDATLRADATLTPTRVEQAWAIPPVEVDFEIWGYMASGLTVKYMKVTEKSNYDSVKWVRYMAGANGSYQVRVSSPVPSFGEYWARADRFDRYRQKIARPLRLGGRKQGLLRA